MSLDKYISDFLAPIIALGAGMSYPNANWAPRAKPRASKAVRKRRRAKKDARKNNRKG